MRKNIIALMLVLPLLFVFTVFSSGNVASLGVSVSANSVEIMNPPEGDTLRIDLATYRDDYRIVAKVYPENAANKAYSFLVEEVEGTEFASVSVDEEGFLHASSVGSARVSAVSNDGGYKDSITVIVSSSKPYGLELSLYPANDPDGDSLLEEREDGYSARVDTGLYAYKSKILPSGFSEVSAAVTEGFAAVDAAAGTVLLPFGGEAVVSFTVKDGAFGDIVRTVTLFAEKPHTVSGFTVNGGTDASIVLERESAQAAFYVEAEEEPVLLPDANISDYTVERAEGAGEGCYVVTVTFAQDRAEEFTAQIAAGGGRDEIRFSFEEFAFTIRSDLPAQGGDQLAVLLGEPVTFYAVPSVVVGGISYVWEVRDCTSPEAVSLSVGEDGRTCTVLSASEDSFTLRVLPYRNGNALDVLPVSLSVNVVRPVTSVQAINETDVGLARRTAFAGWQYSAGGSLTAFRYELNFVTYYNTETVDAVSDLEFTVSDPSVLSVSEEGGRVYVRAIGTGEATVRASWKGNDSFAQSVSAAVTLTAVADAIRVTTSDELYAVSKAGRAAVLDADIMLGTKADGSLYSVGERINMLGSMKSTYNTEYYKNTGRESEAYVKFALEFRGDVYGNGHTVNAGYFTAAKDASGVSQIFRGPLYFVDYGQIASVAGQDNIAFLIRTDGVMLYNLTLLGCSDEALLTDDGTYDLSHLNETGTTLEINADAELINCRVRNGRNVVRVYGGNRDGNSYFIEHLSENRGTDEERIVVTVEGCILSQAREFIVKTGSNRALRANGSTLDFTDSGKALPEPCLFDENGKAYSVQTNDYLDDDYFYHTYVMTDLTLKDSVLETSGLFSVGVETNFAGGVLYEEESSLNFEGWPGTGGTSFPAVLRLEGDVRLYDWKDLSLVDSSTLIDSDRAMFKLDIAAMLDYVCNTYEGYGELIDRRGDVEYVHGGIALYGGGKNYSQVDLRGLDASLADCHEYLVNLSMLADAGGETGQQGTFLPAAAGSQDFRFYMYGSDSANNSAKQAADEASGSKYLGIRALSAIKG